MKGMNWDILSGNLTVCFGKTTILIGNRTEESMFYSYVKLLEGRAPKGLFQWGK